MRQRVIGLTFLLGLTCLARAAAAQTLSDLVVVDIIPFTYANGEGVPLETVPPGTPVFFDFYIQNQGAGAVVAASVRLSVYVDSGATPLERGLINQMAGLAPGAKHGDIATTNPWVATAGAHTFRFVVDDTNLEHESNEDNNTTLFTINVGSGPSFRASIAPSPVTLAPGGTQNVTVTTSADQGFSGTITYSFSGFPAALSTGGTKAVSSPYAPVTFTFSDFGLQPGSYNGQLNAATSSGTQTFPLTVTVQAAGSGALVVPIVLDVTTPIAHFTTELTYTNRGTTAATLALTYTGSIEGAAGSGTTTDAIPAGVQVVIPDAIAYLSQRGVGSGVTGNRGGTLRVQFSGASGADAVAVSARTTTATAPPQPVGSAGLAYAAVPASSGFNGSAVIYGLRSNDQDRSNVALYNPSSSAVTVRVTAFSGAGDGGSKLIRDSETLPPLGWLQYSGILDTAGFANGWAVIEKTGGDGSFGGYGVVNDNGTSDGSFVLPVPLPVGPGSLTVPVLVETPSFRSELVLLNRASVPASLTLTYRESLTPALGAGGSTTLTLNPGQQLIVPEAVDFLRGKGLPIGPKDAASYAGALRVAVSVGEVFAGARTAARSPAAGQFGLFTPGVYAGQEASAQAFLYGLRADAQNRSNVAVENTGDTPLTLELRAYDGAASGAERGAPAQLVLAPGEWSQLSGFPGNQGVANGWVKVTRVAGSSPWVAYGVVNDGGAPGERTGDGAYVPMAVP